VAGSVSTLSIEAFGRHGAMKIISCADPDRRRRPRMDPHRCSK
jgi:hypothetical protein